MWGWITKDAISFEIVDGDWRIREGQSAQQDIVWQKIEVSKLFHQSDELRLARVAQKLAGARCLSNCQQRSSPSDSATV